MNPFFNLVIILFGSIASLQAQVRMESLTVADGLSQGYVTEFLQDHHGFIWMGTFDGLNRYDGYSFRHFKPKPFDSLSIQSSYITSLYEDHQHFIWVGTTEGVYIFEPLKERFFRLSNHLPANFVTRITGDKSGNIFVQIALDKDPLGVFHLRLPENFKKLIADGKNPIADIRIQQVPPASGLKGKQTLMECIGDTMILVMDSRNVCRYSLEQEQFLPFDLSRLPRSNTIEHQLLRGINSSTIFRYQRPDGTDYILPNAYWKRVLPLEKGHIGIRLSDKGPLVLAKSSNSPITVDSNLTKDLTLKPDYFHEELTTLLSEQTMSTELANYNSILMADKGGIIWMATGGWGIRKINANRNAFGKLLTGKSVSSIRELTDDLLWIRLYNDVSFVLNTKTNEVVKAPWASALGEKWFYEVLLSRQEVCWAVTPFGFPFTENRLLSYDKKTGIITRFPEILPFFEGVPEKIMEDRDGNIWIGAHKGHLYRCRAGQKTLDQFSYSALLSQDKRHNLRNTAITQDAHGTLWIGTNRGLIRVDDPNSASPRFTLLRHDVGNLTSLSIDWVTSICVDPNDADALWLGTRGGGLNRLHTPTKTFSYWSEAPNGLPDNAVYGILMDDAGNLWCSTNRGLCRFSPGQNTFITYQESDGLSSTEFNTNSFLRTRDGRLWFGGVSGLNVFKPEEIIPQNTLPPVAITGIKVRGVQRFPDDEGFLTLPFEENNILFEFAVLDFANPATNKFRHRLKGIEHDWVYDGTVHHANYSALPSGRYVFELQGATADSHWSTQTVTFTLVILSPWYRTWLAYIIYLLILFGVTVAYIRYREQVFRLENTAMLTQRESERLKEFEALKNQFFANIAHELRTPLTVIQGLANRLRHGVKGDSVQENAQQILQQGEQLLHLTNQVLDLARLEDHQFQLQVHAGNIIPFIKNHLEALVPLASSKDIQLTMEAAAPDLWLDFDHQQLQKILNNLITNAIRHTPSGGQIRVKTALEHDGQWVRISVSDTGEGISPEDLPHIFERFFQSNKPNSIVGASGIGLTLTRDLVQLMGGRVTVDSTPGAGSTFSIILPVTVNTTPNPEQVARPVTPGQPVINRLQTHDPNLPLLLVIEDNADLWAFLRLCLHPHFRLVHASNGETGIQKAFELIPDLILTDVAMPVKNGYEVASTLKSDERTSHIPIAMLTAKVEANDRMEGYRRGANAYLIKPFEESELLLVLQNLLHLQQQWKHRYEHYWKHRQKQEPGDLPPEEVSVEDQFMQKLQEIFAANYMDESFNLDKLCRIMNISSSQLDRKLKALTDQSPMTMLRIYRLQIARSLIQNNPQISIKEVCFQTGFKNQSHFSRLYSKEFGMPPSEG